MKTALLHTRRFFNSLRIGLMRASSATGLARIPFTTICAALAFVIPYSIVPFASGSFGAAIGVSLAVTTVTVLGLSAIFASGASIAEIESQQEEIRFELVELRRSRAVRLTQQHYEDEPAIEATSVAVPAIPAIVQEPPEKARASGGFRKIVVSLFLLANFVAVLVGTITLAILIRKNTKRLRNYCGACGHTWFPRGSSVSRVCPACTSPEVGLADFRGATAVGWIVCAIFAFGIFGLSHSAKTHSPMKGSLDKSSRSNANNDSSRELESLTKYLNDKQGIVKQNNVPALPRLDADPEPSTTVPAGRGSSSETAQDRSAAKPPITKRDSPPPTTMHWLNTSSGVRHNRSCRYYGNTKNGRPCTATAGSACKICGG